MNEHSNQVEEKKAAYGLEQRLISFAADIINFSSKIPNGSTAHLTNQLIRSGTSPALNYAEARGAESRRDFIHKMGIAVKELRETHVCLQILDRTGRYRGTRILDLIDESDQLIAIFTRSLKTAKPEISEFKVQISQITILPLILNLQSIFFNPKDPHGTSFLRIDRDIFTIAKSYCSKLILPSHVIRLHPIT